MARAHELMLTTVLMLLTVGTSISKADPKLNDSLAFYKARYAVKDTNGKVEDSSPYLKRVQSNGTGLSNLAGTRNFRAVLPGLVYRGGASGAVIGPLSPKALTNLCNEGFGTAIYLYQYDYDRSQKKVKCSVRGDVSAIRRSKNELTYLDKLPLDKKLSNTAINDILKLVHSKLTSSIDPRPIYLHCWNGWHASGFASAIILRQFCGVSGNDALEYWRCNTDNNKSGYSKVKRDIVAFTPIANLRISSDLRQRVCPSMKSLLCPAVSQ